MSGQSIPEMMEALSGDDWSAVNSLMRQFEVNPEKRARNEAQQREKQAQRDRYLAALATIFASDDGQVVLEELLNGTVRRVTFQTQIGIDPQQAHAYGCFREGQNSVVAAILKDLAEVGGGVAPEKETNDEWRTRARARAGHLGKSGKRRWWHFWR